MNKCQTELNLSLQNQTVQKRQRKWHITPTYKLFEAIDFTMI